MSTDTTLPEALRPAAHELTSNRGGSIRKFTRNHSQRGCGRNQTGSHAKARNMRARCAYDSTKDSKEFLFCDRVSGANERRPELDVCLAELTDPICLPSAYAATLTPWAKQRTYSGFAGFVPGRRRCRAPCRRKRCHLPAKQQRPGGDRPSQCIANPPEQN